MSGRQPIILGLERVAKPSFAAHFRLGRFRTPYHIGLRHKLLYAENGVVFVETERNSFLLPARHGAWVPSGTLHRTRSMARGLMMRSLFFEAKPEKEAVALPPDLVVFPISTLAREMILYTARWNYDHPGSHAETAFFEAMRALIPEWCASPLTLRLPIPKEPAIQAVTQYMYDHLSDPLAAPAIAARFGMSSRTLLRWFKKDLGMTYQQYSRMARVVHAFELLANTDMSVTAIALEVGYSSMSTFSQTFRELTGLSPTDFKQVVGR